jgi:hypothetical protein
MVAQFASNPSQVYIRLMSWTKPGAVLAAGLAVVFLLATRNGTRSGAPISERLEPVQDLFGGSVPVLAIELDAASMRSLRAQPRQWVRGTLRAGAEAYPNVSVHIKGSQGSLQPIDARPSLTVSFTKLVRGRKFQGHRKIYFNNAAGSGSSRCSTRTALSRCWS